MPEKEKGSAENGLTDLTKSVEGLVTKIENVATKDDLKNIDKQFNDLDTKVKELSADIKVGKDRVTDDPKRGYKHVGEYAFEVMKACSPEHQFQESDRLKAIKKAVTGVSQGNPADVGYLFPPGFLSGVNETAPKADDLLSRVRKIPVDSHLESIRLTYVKDENRTSGIRGGMAAYWKSEADQMTGTKPALRVLELRPQELYAFAYATDKSLRNAPIALGAWLQEGMRDAVAFKIGDTIVNGDGAAKPLGILNSPDKIEVAKETSQGAATINHVNIEKMWKRMPAWMRTNAIWLANQDIEDQLSRMARSAIKNDGTALESADTVAAYNEEKNTLKGRPVVFSEYSATLGTVGDLVLWAPQHYLVATGKAPRCRCTSASTTRRPPSGSSSRSTAAPSTRPSSRRTRAARPARPSSPSRPARNHPQPQIP
jgi:HK97 family phage major capsid protein